MRIAAAILAGGKASRLGGIVKGLMPDGHGLAIVERLISELRSAGIEEVAISANDPRPFAHLNRPIIADIHRDIGPLGGIHAILEHLYSRFDSVVFLPSDLPAITAEEILKLVRAQQTTPDRVIVAASKEADGALETAAALRDHPLCVVVPVKLLADVSAAIASESYGVGRLWRALGAVTVEIVNSRLLNINTPEDLRQWQESAGQQGRD